MDAANANESIGFIGVGALGAPIAANLLAAGKAHVPVPLAKQMHAILEGTRGR
jgi:3-hydroxyisobutyrate dehydrogenase-like beta-hydroxyacid dehydrogenase